MTLQTVRGPLWRPPATRRLLLDTERLAQAIAELATDRKALDVVVLDLRGHAAYADFLVIASGTSDRHVQAVAEHVSTELAKAGQRPIGSEGLRQGQWALVDFGAVVLHVFHQYSREVYDLEAMWRDVPRLAVQGATVSAQHASQ